MMCSRTRTPYALQNGTGVCAFLDLDLNRETKTSGANRSNLQDRMMAERENQLSSVMRVLRTHWPALFLTLAALIWLTPAILVLAKHSWQTEAGSIGPLTLLCGLFLLKSEMDLLNPVVSGRWTALNVTGVAIGFILYAYAVTISFGALAVSAAWLVMFSMLCMFLEFGIVRRLWFPLAYLLLAIPLPYSLTLSAGAKLGEILASCSSNILTVMGFAVATRGTGIFVDQYELAVEVACAGISSTVSLVAVGAAYARWSQRNNNVQLVALLLASIPIAFAANLFRVLILVVGVHFMGSRLLDSAVHPLSGAISFALALTLCLIFSRMMTMTKKLVLA